MGEDGKRIINERAWVDVKARDYIKDSSNDQSEREREREGEREMTQTAKITRGDTV